MAIEFRKKPGIVAYLTAGDPDLATTRDIALAAIDNGADVIELGVPFSDPLADGPVIQRASERAVARGTRLTDVLGLAKELRTARPAAGLVLFSYLNPVVRMGMTTFCSHGGYCYPTHVRVNGQKMEALRLINCKIGSRNYEDKDEVFYSVDVVRSLIRPACSRAGKADRFVLQRAGFGRGIPRRPQRLIGPYVRSSFQVFRITGPGMASRYLGLYQNAPCDRQR